MPEISPRRQATKERIDATFLQLLQEVGFQALTIRLLIQRAQINRSTFYDYYLDKYDLLEQLEKDWLDELRSILRSDYLLATQNKEGLEFAFFTAHTHNIVRFIHQHQEKVTLFFANDSLNQFIDKFKEVIASVWQREQIPEKIRIPADYLLAAISSLLIGLIQQWIASHYREREEELVYIFQTLTQPIIESVLDQA